MGNSTSRVVGCFVPVGGGKEGVNLDFLEPLDEGLGHSFCYVRPVIVDSPAITPSISERYTLDSSTFDSETHSGSFRQEIVEELAGWQRPSKSFAETTFKTISGASVSANASTARTPTVFLSGDVQEPAASFESTASFASIPLQPVPRGSGPLNGFMSGPLERGFASGPLERGAGMMSGPLDKGGFMSGPLDPSDRSNFSAPLGYDRRRGLGRLMRSMSRPMRSALSHTFSRRSLGSGWMQRFFLHSREAKIRGEARQNGTEVGPSEPAYSNSRNLQWAHGKAGEDRVHVVLSEEQGWLFVGIYDGFSGPDAPDFLMSNLYKSIDKELEGLLWDYEDKPQETAMSCSNDTDRIGSSSSVVAECTASLMADDEDKPQMSPQMSGTVETDTNTMSSSFDTEEHTACQMADAEPEKGHVDFPVCNDQNQGEGGDKPIKINKDEIASKPTADTAALKNESAGADESVEEKVGAASSEMRQEHDQKLPESTAGQIDDIEKSAPSILKAESDSAKQLRKSKRLYELLQMELVEDMHARDAQHALHSERSKQEIPEGTGGVRESEGVQLEDSKELKPRASLSSQRDKQLMKRSLIGSKLRKMYSKQKTLRKKFFPWSYDWHRDQHQADDQVFNQSVIIRRCKSGPVDHHAVLRAMAQALATTEKAYMDMVESSLDRNPELALMGSCVLVMLMKDQDVYVMNLGDSRVILGQERLSDHNICGNQTKDEARNRNRSRESLVRVELDRISEESPMHNPNSRVCSGNKNREISLCRLKMRAVQLSTDHSTSIEEEVVRIKAEHVDDVQAVMNERVKGQLKVTRAFGAGFLKKPSFNDALLEMFRVDYIGTSPYLSCKPSVLHHRLCSSDRFLVLSSDGLYQYFSNEEVVSHVAWFMESVPEGDPAQYLIAELLLRAAKKNGMDFHELLDIPHGDRRKYHDDVSVMVISLEGRIWRSSG